MYHNLIFLITFAQFIFTGNLSFGSLTNNEPLYSKETFFIHNNTTICPEIITVSKAKLRIDYNGQYRSYNTLVYIKRDTHLILEIRSVFGIVLNKIYATPSDFIFTNESEKVSFILDYNYLSTQLGFNLDFHTFFNILTGFSNISSEKNFNANKILKRSININPGNPMFEENALNIIRITFLYNMVTSKLYEYTISVKPNISLISAFYSWNSYNEKVTIPNVTLNFIYGNQEVGLEVDYKSMYNDSILPTFVDTLYTNQYLIDI